MRTALTSAEHCLAMLGTRITLLSCLPFTSSDISRTFALLRDCNLNCFFPTVFHYYVYCWLWVFCLSQNKRDDPVSFVAEATTTTSRTLVVGVWVSCTSSSTWSWCRISNYLETEKDLSCCGQHSVQGVQVLRVKIIELEVEDLIYFGHLLLLAVWSWAF